MDKQDLLTIGEVSTRSGLAPSALRYYESLGLITSTRTSGDRRRFARGVLRRVAVIRAAQQVGLSLDQVGSTAKRAAVYTVGAFAVVGLFFGVKALLVWAWHRIRP